MPTISDDQVAWHGVLVAGQVTDVAITGRDARVEILSHDGASAVWFTLNGETPAPLSPDCYVIPKGAIGADDRIIQNATTQRVRLIVEADTLVTVSRRFQ
jgi:hypothetical protein